MPSSETKPKDASKYFEVEFPEGVRGRLDAAQLADHPAAVEALRGAVTAGAALGRLLVLERLEVSLWIFARSSTGPKTSLAGMWWRRWRGALQAADAGAP